MVKSTPHLAPADSAKIGRQDKPQDKPMTLPPFDAILFDFDGTLATSTLDFDEMRRRLNALTLSQGIAAAELKNLYMLELIDHAADWLNQRQAGHGDAYRQQADQLIEDIEVEAARTTGLLPGIPELLQTLRQRDIGIGVVTRNCDRAVRIMFPQIDAYCQAVFARDHVTHVKPHPAHLHAALGRLRCTPEQTLMVGDGDMDIQAGKELNMFTIGVLTGTGSRESLRRRGADLVLDHAADLLNHLPAAKKDQT